MAFIMKHIDPTYKISTNMENVAQLPDGCYEMTYDHLEEVKHIMAEGFLTNNQIWSSFDISKEDILVFFDKLLRGHLESQKRSKATYGDKMSFNHIYVRNGKIITSVIHYELEDYKEIQKTEEPAELELFKELEKAGKELIQVVNLANYAPGTAAYANFGTVRLGEEISTIYKMIMFITIHTKLKEAGIRWVIGRVSNVRAMELYKRLGAVVLKEAVFERNDKKFPLFFFELDLNSQAFIDAENSIPKLFEKEAAAKAAKK